MKQVAITGLGLVTCLGKDVDRVLRGVEQKESGLREATDDEKRLGVKAVGEIKDFKFASYYKAAGFKRLMSREASLAIVAAKFALEDGHVIPGENIPNEDISLYAGSGASGLDFKHIIRMVDASAGDDGHFDEDLFSTVGLKRIHPLLSFKILPNMPPCFLSILHGIQGDNLIFNPWEGNTGQAILEGYHRVKDGFSPSIVGGSDVKTHTQAFVFLNQVGVLPEMGPPGEGAAFVVLEERDKAKERKAPIHSLLLSCAETVDEEAMWSYSKNKDILAQVMEKAIDKAGRKPDFVVTSQSGCKESDEAEEAAIEELCGSVERLVPKAVLGDTFAAAGAIALALASHKVAKSRGTGLVNCFGNGRERLSFIVGAP